MVKKLLSLMTAFAMLISMTACGAQKPAAMAKEEKVTIRILTRFSDDTALSRAFQERLVPRFDADSRGG